MKKKFLTVIALAACLLAGCGNQLSENAKAAQSAIDALPASYSDDAEEAYSNARSLYDALPDSDKNDVKKDKLDALEQSRNDVIVKPAEELNQKIKDLSLKYGTAEELQQSVDDLNDILNSAEKLPPAAVKLVDFEGLAKQATELTDKTNQKMSAQTADAECISTAASKYASAADWLSVNEASAYTDMLDAVSALEGIKNYDATQAIKAGKTLAGDFRSLASGSAAPQNMVMHAEIFGNKLEELQNKALDDVKPYLEASEGLEDVLENILKYTEDNT